MSKVHLRPYQEQALDAEDEHRREHPDENRLLISMATGLGKTITFAERARRFLARNIEDRSLVIFQVLILVHTDELTRQAVEKVRLVCGDAWSVGVVKATQNEVTADIVVASVQTLIQPGRKEQIADVRYIIVDEAHHAISDSYTQILEYYGGLPGHDCPERPCWDCHDTGYTAPPTPVLGVTATPARSDGAGLGPVWHDLVFSRETTWAMRKGYLVDLVPYTISIPGFEYTESATGQDVQLAGADSLAPETIVDAWLEKTLRVNPTDLEDGSLPLYLDRPSTVLFAPGVASAYEFARAFSDAGVKAECVHGGTPKEERRAILDRYEAGITTVLCNAMVLTEGWDSPRTKCVIVARPTKSVPLFIQMVGRGLRPWLSAQAPPREEQRCILLSIAGAANDLASAADLSDKLAEVADGQSLLAMEDQWDIGAGIEDKPAQYVGPVRVEQWDEMVARSSKAWKYTAGGVPFLPTAKKRQGYVFIVGTDVWARTESDAWNEAGRHVSVKVASAPDLELAMALAEDEAQERGGDIGRLLADKGRAWRKAVPSQDMQDQARRVRVPEADVVRILTSKQSGKAGKLSDLIDKVTASRVLDPIAARIKERASR